MSHPARAHELANLARANGWEVELDVELEHVDLRAQTTYAHPDTGDGWAIGVMLRWYASRGARGRLSWRLGSLDDAGRQVIGGVAQRLKPERVLVQAGYGGRFVDRPVELEFWLGSLALLRKYLEDPALLAQWLEEEPATDRRPT